MLKWALAFDVDDVHGSHKKMAIEISAKLNRGSVYFTSESVKCIVTFKNTSHPDRVKDSHSSTQLLAWAGAQIYCHCCVDESKVKFISESSDFSSHIVSPGTSFNPCNSERGYAVFSTKPKILFCGLTLAPGEVKTFVYKEQIPLSAPPSYYGSSVKYLYKLTIGTQRVKSGIQLLRIPLRILSALDQKQSQGSLHLDLPVYLSTDDKQSSPGNKEKEVVVAAAAIKGETGSSTPPASSALSDEEVVDLVIHRLDCLTSRRCSNTYVITNQLGQVAKFCLLKSNFKLGEDVIGVFNFADATVPCVQFSVTLQSEEIISDSCRVPAPAKCTMTTSYTRQSDFCLNTEYTQVILPIPLTVTPSFQTNILTLNWRLHFEFVTTRLEQLRELRIPDTQGVLIKPPAGLSVNTLTWHLPLQVYPNHPVQVARGLQLPSSASLVV